MKRIEEAKQNNQIPKIGDIFNDHVRFHLCIYLYLILLILKVCLFSCLK